MTDRYRPIATDVPQDTLTLARSSLLRARQAVIRTNQAVARLNEVSESRPTPTEPPYELPGPVARRRSEGESER